MSHSEGAKAGRGGGAPAGQPGRSSSAATASSSKDRRCTRCVIAPRRWSRCASPRRRLGERRHHDERPGLRFPHHHRAGGRPPPGRQLAAGQAHGEPAAGLAICRPGPPHPRRGDARHAEYRSGGHGERAGARPAPPPRRRPARGTRRRNACLAARPRLSGNQHCPRKPMCPPTRLGGTSFALPRATPSTRGTRTGVETIRESRGLGASGSISAGAAPARSAWYFRPNWRARGDALSPSFCYAGGREGPRDRSRQPGMGGRAATRPRSPRRKRN